MRPIRKTWELRSASQILIAGGRTAEVGQKRAVGWHVDTGEGRIHLRDQAPLHAGNIDFGEGWSFSDVVELLNQHVYFWPGDDEGPIPYGQRHFERYRNEAPAILRVRTSDLIDVAGDRLRLCAYNSGAPRCSGGRKSPRGGDTFDRPSSFSRPASGVVEIVVEGQVTLPDYVEAGSEPSGPFAALGRSG